MYLLTEGKWQSGYCDYEIYRDDHVKIRVNNWYLLGKVDNQYISYPSDWRILYNYLMDVGVRAVFLKLLSRLREKNRNAKYYAIGSGTVTETGNKSKFTQGQPVVFFAANHPECVSSIVLPEAFVADFSEKNDSDSKFVQFFKNPCLKFPEQLEEYIGWSCFSGAAVRTDVMNSALTAVTRQIANAKAEASRKLAVADETQILKSNTPAPGLMQAALFGLGNYAKVFIIPNLDKRICLSAVHEIDPAQLGLKQWGKGYLSTSPTPPADRKFDVYFAAGYHHTHAGIAAHALKHGACAVVEKPVATTGPQLAEISELLEAGNGRFFACFHKRYSQLNDWVQEDLRNEPGNAIDYHCIVYEIPLPQRHWYNWQNSGSRIVSNGCHWIDHFMFLNAYSPARKHSIIKAARGQIYVHIELENLAVFSMLLTDEGSPRLGVRDYIELRKGQTTIVMTDSSQYRSENATGCLRKKNVNKIDAYRRMYATISTTIADGKPGDSVESLRSSKLVIELDKLLQAEKE